MSTTVQTSDRKDTGQHITPSTNWAIWQRRQHLVRVSTYVRTCNLTEYWILPAAVQMCVRVHVQCTCRYSSRNLRSKWRCHNPATHIIVSWSKATMTNCSKQPQHGAVKHGGDLMPKRPWLDGYLTFGGLSYNHYHRSSLTRNGDSHSNP